MRISRSIFLTKVMNRSHSIQYSAINSNNMNILEKADKYADGKANDAITKAIAQAYLDGYRDGYNDREAEIPFDLRDNKTTYVDLGLPSRTLWSTDYEREGDDFVFLPYERAEYSKIPTIEQWFELRDKCKWEFNIYKDKLYWAKCIGPNGNIIKFMPTGMKKAESLSDLYEIYFWLEEDKATKAVNIYKSPNVSEPFTSMRDMFSGYHLPLRLVR